MIGALRTTGVEAVVTGTAGVAEDTLDGAECMGGDLTPLPRSGPPCLEASLLIRAPTRDISLDLTPACFSISAKAAESCICSTMFMEITP